jgi:hypothetical protein
MPADDEALIGTWKLKSFVREVSGTGERRSQTASPTGASQHRRNPRAVSNPPIQLVQRD